MKYWLKNILGLSACVLLSGGMTLSAADIWVTILPQKYFVEAVGGPHVSVEVLVQPGQSPELYAPSAAQLMRLAKADAYVGIGMPVEHAVLPRVLETMLGVQVLQTGTLLDRSHTDHVHGAHGNCVHGDQDPHVWMDPIWVSGMVLQLQQLLGDLLPQYAAEFEANAAGLIEELNALTFELAQQFKPYRERAFYINHPSLGHFAQRFGLKQLSIEQAGSAPSARRIAEMVKQAKAERAGAILSQAQFGRSGANVLGRALGVEVLEVNPLAESYLDNLRAIANCIERSFQR
jgi:zinc transport system substrate-binding protein